MSISERYRTICEEASTLAQVNLQQMERGEKCQRKLAGAAEMLAELEERVGEIPQTRLDRELEPVLLKAHNRLDQARLLLEEGGQEETAKQVWDLEQAIYRLLNSL